MAWRGSKKLFACLIPFYMLLCGATVYIQAHYVIDAIVGFFSAFLLYVVVGQGELVLGDEVLTPDSSRFWPADQWVEGQVTPSYDKQFVRDWLAKESGWDRNSGQQPPALPEQVVERTRERYLEAYERLTGKPLAL